MLMMSERKKSDASGKDSFFSFFLKKNGVLSNSQFLVPLQISGVDAG